MAAVTWRHSPASVPPVAAALGDSARRWQRSPWLAEWPCRAVQLCTAVAPAGLGCQHAVFQHALAGEIGEEYEQRRSDDLPVLDLLDLVEQIVPYDMSHNAGGRARVLPGGRLATRCGPHGGVGCELAL